MENNNQAKTGMNNLFNTSTVNIQRQPANHVQVGSSVKTPTMAPQPSMQASKPVVGTIPSAIPTDAQKARWADKGVMMAAAPQIANKLNAMAAELKQIIVERNDLIDDIIVALATGHHVVMIGTPGIAKSLLSREVCKRIVGGNYFEWLLNKTSDPSEILGPFSIKQLEADKFSRKTSGKLPEAHIAFLDEIFKCNEPTLNALLAITNERVFHNDGVAVPIPLITMFGASNEEPEDESLKALYDRMLFRFIVNPIADAGNRMKMYNGFLQRRNPQSNYSPMNYVTVDELLDIRHAARYVVIPNDVLNQYDAILSDLKIKNQIAVTDRRKNEGLAILQGSAILDGRDVASVDDFRHLVAVWWQRPEDVKVIGDTVMKIVNPYEAKLKDEKNNIEQIIAKVKAAPGEAERAAAAIEAKAQLNNVIRNLDQLAKQAKGNGKDTRKIEELRQECYNHQKVILNQNLGIDETILQGNGFGDIDGSL